MVLSSLTLGDKSSYDPGVLSWASKTWSLHPITLSESNAESSVSITFSFHTLTAVDSGVFCVEFPSTFSTSSSCSSVSGLSADDDYSVTMTSITLPSSVGAHGPFTVYTAVSAAGLILDINKNFGYIWVYDSYTTSDSGLSLTMGSSDVQSETDIIFAFTLTQTLWPSDYFVLTIPGLFSLTSPTCASQSTTLASANAETSTLQCDLQGSELRIYGNVKEVAASDASPVEISIKIGTFTNPSSAVAISGLLWVLKTVRFGSSQVLQAFDVNGPFLNYKKLSINSWAPVVSKSLTSGCNGYLSLNFVLDLEVPKDGTVNFVFSNLDLNDLAWASDESQSSSSGTKGFFYLDARIDAECEITADTSIICTTGSVVSAGSYVLVLLPSLSDDPPTVIVSTTDSDSLSLQVSDEFSLTYSSAVRLTSASVKFSSDNAGSYISSSSSSAIVCIKFKSPVDLAVGDVVKITLPISAKVNSDTLIGIKTSLKASTIASSEDFDNYGAKTLVSNENPTLSSKTLSIKLPTSATSSQNVYIYLSSDNSAASAGVNLPYVASNKLTQYEYSIIIEKVATEYVYAGPLTISSIGYTSMTAQVLCTSTFAGLPFSVELTPSFTYSSSSALYISVEFDGYGSDLGSGLDIGDKYPVDTDLTSVTFTLQKNSIRMQGLKSISSDTTYSFAFPLGFASPGDNPATVKIFYISSNIEFIIMSETVTNTLVDLGTKYFTSATADSVINSATVDPEVLSEFSLKFKLTYSTEYSSGYLGIIFPSGFTFNSPSITQFSDSTKVATITHFFSSSDLLFPSVYFSLSSDFKVPTSSSTYYLLSGITSPIGSLVEEEVQFVLASTSHEECKRANIASNPTLTITAKSFTTKTFTPTSIKARGPDSLLTEVKAILKVPVEIPQGSALVFDVAWTLTSDTSYYISGVSGFTYEVSDQLMIFKNISKIVNGASITLVLSQILVPEEDGDDFQFSSIYIYTDDSYENAIVKYIEDGGVTISSSSDTGVSHFSSATTFPNGVSLTVDLVYLSFTLDNGLAKASLIKIDSPTGSWTRSGDIKHYCFANIKFSSCSISSDKLQITLAQNYSAADKIEIILDGCLELPSSSGNTAKGFTVTTSFYDTVIDKDSYNAPSSLQKIKVQTLPNETFYFTDLIQITPNNIGEQANYTFTFTCDANISLTSYLYISFPREFDPYLGGKVQFKNGDPTKYYIECSSPSDNLENIDCQVDHWTVIITGFSANIVNQTLLSITLHNIYNPSEISLFSIYLMTRNSDLLAYNQSVTSISLIDSGNNTIIKSYSITSKNLRKSTDSTLKLYLSPFTSDSEIIIQFPRQYNIKRDKPSKLKCSGSSSSVSLSGSCYVLENSIIYPVGRASNNYELFTINFNMMNPEWGDSDVPGLYSASGQEFWATSLVVGVRNSGNFSEKTYGQNRAFAGFVENYLMVDVNGFEPKGNLGFLKLKQGTQLIGLTISVESTLRAYSLALQPKNSDVNEAVLIFDSDFNFTLTKDVTSITFMVSTKANSENSINYIEWDIVEDSLNGTSLYSVNAKTMVEVYNLEDIELSLSYGTSSTYKINRGRSGPYIKISTAYPPSSDLTLSMSLLNSSLEGVTFSPSSLTFISGETEKYFSIELSDNFSTSTNTSGPYEYTFTQTGADSTAYKQLGVFYFYQDEFVTYPTAEIKSLSLASITENSVQVKLELSDMAEVYWEFCDYDTPFSSYDELASKIYPLTSENSTNYKIEEQIENYLLGIRTSQNTNELWSSFQKKMLAYSKESCFYSARFIDGSDEVVLFEPNFLWAANDYKVRVFVHNLIDKSEYFNESVSFSTKDVLNPVLIHLKITSGSSAKVSSVVGALAQSIGVPSTRLDLDSSSRRMMFTSASWVLNSDRSSSTSPEDLYKNMDTSLFTSLMKGYSYTLSYSVLKRSNYDVADGFLWVNKTASSYIVIEGDVNGDGSVCCVAELDGTFDLNITAEQVYLGIDRENVNTMSNCTDIVTNWTIVVNGLNADTGYIISCILVNDYPTWPDYSDIYTFNVTSEDYGNDFTTSFSPILLLALPFLLI